MKYIITHKRTLILRLIIIYFGLLNSFNSKAKNEEKPKIINNIYLTKDLFDKKLA